MSVVLFCSDDALARDGDAWRGQASGLEVIALRGTEPVGAADIERIEVVHFSADLYPARTASFLRVATQAPNVRWFHSFSAGVDHPVFQGFVERGAKLTTSAGSSAIPIAHSVVMHLLRMCRHARDYETDQREHRWQPRDNVDVEGRTVGVLGMGSIGSEVARLAQAFGMRVIGTRRTPTGAEPCEVWHPSRLHELLGIVDDVVLTAPLTDETRGMLGAAQLAMLRRGAHLVNVGRGELVDEVALTEALAGGHLGAACLDVFVTEPLPTDSPLWDMPNVTITPHAAGETVLSRRRADALFTDNLGRYARGEALRNEVGR